MKTYKIVKMVLIVLISVFYLPLTHANNSPFIGTWQLVSGEYLNDKQELISYETLGIASQKVINETYFSFVSTANGKFWAAGSGKYSFTDSQYIESPNVASYPLENGGSYSFTYHLEGSLWHNARWHGDTRVEYEVWKKID